MRSEAHPTTSGRIRALVVGLVVALLSAELLLRQIHRYPRYLDPELGPTPVPGSVVISSREGFGRSHWVGHGVRRSTPLDSTRASVLVLGDSFTEAVQVDDRDVYTQLLEQGLRGDAVDWQVVNAGHAGFSAADYIRLAPRNLALFRPRWVVVQLRSEDLGSGAWDARETHFVEHEGRLELARGELDKSAKLGRALLPVLRQSSLLDLAFARVSGASQGQDAEARRSARRKQNYRSREVLDLLIASYSHRITLLWIPPFDARHPDAEGDDIERMVRAVCVERALSCVSLRSAYPALSRAGRAPFGFPNSAYNSGHWNEVGHRAAAELLARELERLRANRQLSP
jgi:hypothetical protein